MGQEVDLTCRVQRTELHLQGVPCTVASQACTAWTCKALQRSHTLAKLLGLFRVYQPAVGRTGHGMITWTVVVLPCQLLFRLLCSWGSWDMAGALNAHGSDILRTPLHQV